MLAAIVVLALGYNAIAFLTTGIDQHFGGWSIEEELRHYQNFQRFENDEWFERHIAMLTYASEHGINNRWGTPDFWRWEAANTLFNMKEFAAQNIEIPNLQVYIDALDQAIRDSDWLAYYHAQLAYFADSEPWLGTPHTVWALNYKIDHELAPAEWKALLVDQIATLRTQTGQLSLTAVNPDVDQQLSQLINELLISEYRLENNIRNYTSDEMSQGMGMFGEMNFWQAFAISYNLIGILSVLIIIIAGSIISSEYSAGTIKFLLINPVKRWKIFAAKYLTVISFVFGMLLLLYIFNLLSAGIFFGFRDVFAPHLSVSNGRVVTGSSLLFTASRYLLGSIQVITLGTFAFAVSSLVRSSALAIGLGVFLYFSGSMAVQILSMMNFYQAKFILFANTNILNVVNGTTGFVNHTLTFAVINICVYMLVFLLTAYDGFVRGEVK
jgi:ABC-2 type transport system permease protein